MSAFERAGVAYLAGSLGWLEKKPDEEGSWLYLAFAGALCKNAISRIIYNSSITGDVILHGRNETEV